jgi:uncharacterized membrane protein (Fun14 family)
MMDLNLTQIGVQAGSGALLGAVVGFAAKQVVKLVAILIGVQLGFLAYLESRKVITVNWNQINSLATLGSQTPETGVPTAVTNALSLAPLGGGFAAGAVVGFKRG